MTTPTVSVYANTDPANIDPANIDPAGREENGGEDEGYMDMALGEDSLEPVYECFEGEDAIPLLKHSLPTEQIYDTVGKDYLQLKRHCRKKMVRYGIIALVCIVIMYTVVVVGISVAFSWSISSHYGQYGENITRNYNLIQDTVALAKKNLKEIRVNFTGVYKEINMTRAEIDNKFVEQIHRTTLLETTLPNMTENLRQATHRVDQLERDLSEQIQRTTLLETNLSDMTDNLGQATHRVFQLERDLSEQIQRITLLETNLSDTTENLGQATHRVVQLERDLSEQIQRITLLETDLSDTTENLRQANHRVDQLERDLSKTKGNVEDTKQRVGQLRADDDVLTRKLSNAETQLNNLQTDHSQHRRRLDGHDRRLFNLERDVNRLESSGSSSPLPAFTVVVFSIAVSISTLI